VRSDIAGFRADLIIVDDPMQPGEVASEFARDALRSWYYGVVAQRLLDQSAGSSFSSCTGLRRMISPATFVEAGGWMAMGLARAFIRI
jgi:hypothetical protein